jgi:hypothetical protein
MKTVDMSADEFVEYIQIYLQSAINRLEERTKQRVQFIIIERDEMGLARVALQLGETIDGSR